MKDNSDSLLKNCESFTPLINLIDKAIENYQTIFSQHLSQINQILFSVENNLQSISTNKIKNIKSLLNAINKSFLTFINDTKISLNNIIKKSKEISLQIMTYNKIKSSIDIDILSSEINQKENEITNLKKEMNFFKDKLNFVNKSYSDARQTITDLQKENTSLQEKMMEDKKNFYINNSGINSVVKSASNIGIGEGENSQLSELKKKIKELKEEIDNNKQDYEIKLSKMSDKNSNLSNFLTKKNQEFTKLQSENIVKIKENTILKKQLEKKNLKESEYLGKISDYQKQIEDNDKDINNKNSEIISLTENINKNKILIKKLEAEI